MNKRIVYIAGWMIVLLLSSCSPRALREARETVVRADSMRAAGQMYEDSSCLAQAYKTLGAIPFPFREGLGVGSAYAHACYHYGRLLRAKENPVAAMQCFIDATHSRTHDYPILGRVYSNMGSIAHLAGEYDLSYTMYSRSSEMFLRANDTTAYYYALNDMAFELAEQGKREETMSLLSKIEVNDADSYLLAKIWETKADAFLFTQQYDSVMYCINQLNRLGYNDPTDILIKAQAYDNLGLKDSAIILANLVLSNPNAAYQDKFNALYIVLHCDSSLCAEDVNSLASQREDIRYYEYEPEYEKLDKAIDILLMDLNKKSDYLWLYVMIVTACIVGGGYYWRYRRDRQRVNDKIGQLVERQTSVVAQSIKQHIDSTDIVNTLHWKKYDAMKADADLYMGGIVSKLEEKKLNETEIRFCILTMLDFSQKQIAETIHYSYPSGIKTLKKRISVKLETTPPNLHDFLFRYTIEA